MQESRDAEGATLRGFELCEARTADEGADGVEGRGAPPKGPAELAIESTTYAGGHDGAGARVRERKKAECAKNLRLYRDPLGEPL